MAGEQTLTFDSSLPPGVVALLVALLVGGAVWSVLRSRASTRVRAAIVALRAIAALALAVALLGPVVRTRDEIVLKPRALLLLDASQSMLLQDTPGEITRRRAVLDKLAAEADRVTRLSTTHDVSRFDFGTELRETVQWTAVAEDRLTSTGDAIAEATRRLKGRPGGNLVIFSDGRTTVGHDPVRAASQARERGVKIHTVGVGTAGSATFRDRKLAIILCPSVAQVQSAVPIQAFVVALGERGQTFKAHLKIDDELIETKELVSDEDRYSTRVSFVHTPATIGEKRVTVEVDAGEGEFDPKNNSMTTFLRVLHKDLQVLYLEGKLRWEFTFLRRVLAQIPDSHIATHNLFGTEELPDPKLLDQAAVIIIGDTTAARLGPAFLEALERRVREREAGLLFLAGSENLAAGAEWAGTPMEALLPFGLAGASSPAEEPTGVQLTAFGSDHFAMALERAPGLNATAWKSLPKLEAFAHVGPPKPAATVLANAESGDPLLIAQPYGNGRTLAFLGEMTWKWALDNEGAAEKYRRFWHQCVLWLARKEKSARRLSVDLPRCLYLAGDPIDVKVTVENPPGTPVSDAAVRVTVEGPGGDAPAPTAAWYGGAYRTSLSPSEPGDYRLTVVARRGEDDFGESTARFTVISPSVELDQPAPDIQALMATAAAGGGVYRPVAEFRDVLERLNSEAEPVRIERVRQKSFWDRPWLILVFVGALAVEWFLRKRNGMA